MYVDVKVLYRLPQPTPSPRWEWTGDQKLAQEKGNLELRELPNQWWMTDPNADGIEDLG